MNPFHSECCQGALKGSAAKVLKLENQLQLGVLAASSGEKRLLKRMGMNVRLELGSARSVAMPALEANCSPILFLNSAWCME